MESVNQQFVVSALIIGLGWVLRRTVLGEADTLALVRLVFNVTLPALVVNTLGRATLVPALGLLTVIALAHGLAMGALGGLVLFRRRARRERGALAMLIPGINIGLFAYPFVEGTLGVGALTYLGMFDVGVAFITFGVSYGIAAHFARPDAPLDLRSIGRALARSLPMVAYALSLLLALAGLRLPGVVLDVAAVLARANMPAALLILGMVLTFEKGAGLWSDVALVLGVRYGVGLSVGAALYLLLPFDQTFRLVVLLCLVMPPALSSVAFAVQFGQDRRLVALVLNVASVVSYFLMWGIIAALRG